MQQLRVMAEYECHPIWRDETNGTSNIAPDDLALPGDLASRFNEWALTFDETYAVSDPPSSEFADAVSRDQFYERGLALARELGVAIPDAEVRYFDGRSGATRLI